VGLWSSRSFRDPFVKMPAFYFEIMGNSKFSFWFIRNLSEVRLLVCGWGWMAGSNQSDGLERFCVSSNIA